MTEARGKLRAFSKVPLVEMDHPYYGTDFNVHIVGGIMATLNDKDIIQEIRSAHLIRKATEHGVSGACYELRMGSVYYDLTEGAKRVQIKEGEDVLVKPGHRVVLISEEVLDVPSDILVRIISKGSLFSIGLTPV